MMVIDGDAHLFERADLWMSYAPRDRREDAVRIETDALGYPVMTLRGHQLGLTPHVTNPGQPNFDDRRRVLDRRAAGLPNDDPPYAEMPASFWEPAARIAALDAWGIDQTVLFPQWGLDLTYFAADDAAALTVNLSAWNRWVVEVNQAGAGRLHPAGHVVLDADPAWVVAELDLLARGGVRLVLCSPALAGRTLADPSLDAVWTAVVARDLVLVWHVNASDQRVFRGGGGGGSTVAGREQGSAGGLSRSSGAVTTPEWRERHRSSTSRLVNAAARRGLAGLATGGVLAAHPELRIIVAELGTAWLPDLLNSVGAAADQLRDAVTLVASFPGEADPVLLREHGDLLAFGADFPHSEGLADPLREYLAAVGTMPPAIAGPFFGGNLHALLG